VEARPSAAPGRNFKGVPILDPENPVELSTLLETGETLNWGQAGRPGLLAQNP
jgi:hypothetical protein